MTSDERIRSTEKALRDSRTRLSLALAASGMGIWEWDVLEDRVSWSPECREIIGDTEVRSFEAILHVEDRERVLAAARAAVSTRTAFIAEFRITRPDNSVRWLDCRGQAGENADGKGPGLIGTLQDVTDRKESEQQRTKLEQQLLQAQKMEAVGQLTSGIAHDFNNILCSMIGFATLLKSKLGPDDPARIYADHILNGTDRAANLIRSLLTFSRKQIADLRPVDLNDVVRRVGKLLHWIIGEDIELSTAFATGPLKVNADPGQIEQVLMNLATNAADAMPRGGVLSIETAVVNRDAEGRAAEDWDQRSVMLSVTDTGAGMDEKTRERIFEPFFTTKDLGRDTGLGLAMVYGIIKQHRGSIHCASAPGAGTKFTIYLPLLRSAGAVAEPKTVARPAPEMLRGSETVLLAEDDKAMLSFVRTTLETFGYRVIEAKGGNEAIELFRQHREDVGIVIADVVMPGMSGAELQQAVREACPDVPVLFMSGYPAETVYRKSLLNNEAEILPKPFQPDVLLRKVRALLERRTGNSGPSDRSRGPESPMGPRSGLNCSGSFSGLRP